MNRHGGSAGGGWNRRSFLKAAAGAALGAGLGAGRRLSASPGPMDKPTKNTVEDLLPAKAVTTGPNHHWFGYYDKTPWDKTGRYMLAMRSDFMGRQPDAKETIILGRVDLQDNNRFLPFATTQAWCWQQGTMLQWMPTAADREVIYNIQEGDEYRSVVHDLASGEKRTLSRPVYCITSDGKNGVSLNFSRLHRCRPGYGYASLPDKGLEDRAPADDGLRHVDLTTGKNRLIIPYKFLADNQPLPSFEGPKIQHWAYHAVPNPSGTRFLFLHRWGVPGTTWTTRLYTSDLRGERIRLLNDFGMTSHFDWRDDGTILAWANGPQGNHYYLIADNDDPPEKRFTVMGDGVLTRDGHCTYTPDRKWVLTDTYVDDQYRRTLILYHPATDRRINIGRFHHPKELLGPWRCDPHPRFNRDGTQVCIDSAHETTRQMYVVDVSKYTRG